MSETGACVHYYVYYRVRAKAEHEDAQATVRAMQAAIEKRTGVAARLMERRDDALTWMEVYEAVPDPDAFEVALRIETEAFRVGEIVEPGSARHVERFVECA